MARYQLAGGGSVEVFETSFDGGERLYFQRYDATGAAVGPQTQITQVGPGGTATGIRDVVVKPMSDGGFVVGVESVYRTLPGSKFTMFNGSVEFVRYDGSGARVGGDFISHARPGDGEGPFEIDPVIVEAGDGGFFALYTHSPDQTASADDLVFAVKYGLPFEERPLGTWSAASEPKIVVLEGGGGVVVLSGTQGGFRAYDEAGVQLSSAALSGPVLAAALEDGGFVVTGGRDGSRVVQKYDEAGATVGPQQVVASGDSYDLDPLSNGGFVYLRRYLAGQSGTASEGAVYGADGAQVATFTGGNTTIVTSPLGGFLKIEASRQVSQDSPTDPTIQLFDNAGQPISPASPLAGHQTPMVTVDEAGRYVLNWTDGTQTQTLTLDPRSADLVAPDAPTVVGIDDVQPVTGEFTFTTNDRSPVLRVAVEETGYVGVKFSEFSVNSSIPFPYSRRVTAEDVARGYIDFTFNPLAISRYDFHVRLQDEDGFVSPVSKFSFTIDTSPPSPPGFVSVFDDQGAITGPVANGGATDDTTPTIKLQFQMNSLDYTIQFYNNGAPLGAPQQVNSAGNLTFTTPGLAAGEHRLSAELIEPGTGNSARSSEFVLRVQPDAGGSGLVVSSPNTPTTLTGGAGNDTVIAGRSRDTLTGGEGADHFRVDQLPWSPSVVTDFQDGADRLDLRALFQANGYAGSSPVADGHLTFDAIEGGTRVSIRFDGLNNGWPYSVIDLQGVSPGQLSAADVIWRDGAAEPPPPPPPPTGGQVVDSDQTPTTLTGGAGNDTVVAGRSRDTLTGGEGADHFRVDELPWSPSIVTDFQDGTDRLDLRALLQAQGYAGSDPVADGAVRFDAVEGGTRVSIQFDGLNNGWPYSVIDLQGVSPGQLSAADLVWGSGPPPPPPPPTGQVVDSDQTPTTLTGGAGNDTIVAGRSNDTLTGGEGADHFRVDELPWSPSVVTDFQDGADKLDLRALFQAQGYSGSDPIADGHLLIEAREGGVRVSIDFDGLNNGWPYSVIDLQGVSASQITLADVLWR